MVKRDGRSMDFYLADNLYVQVVIDNWLEKISKLDYCRRVTELVDINQIILVLTP